MQFLHIQNHPKLFDAQSSASHPPGIQLFVYQTYSLYREREREIERERMRKMFGWQWKLQRSEIKELLNRLLVVRHLTLSKIKKNEKYVSVNTSGDSVDTAVNIATICRLIDKQCKLYYLTCEDACVAGGCGAMCQLQLWSQNSFDFFWHPIHHHWTYRNW